MKKILAIAAVAALTAGVSAYAANPFSDVSTSDWAYQAVSDLSDQGIVEGYPDGTFKGQQNMTRYELAQIIARLMAKEDQLNAEQRATVDKLAAQYADELANLGVRVANVEKKLGNVAFSGDSRVRYMAKKNGATDVYDARVRLNAKAKVNAATTINSRLVGNMNFRTGGDATVQMDILNVNHNFGFANVTVGRYTNGFGNQGAWFTGITGFDGVQAQFKVAPVDLAVGYGRFNKKHDVESVYAKGNVNLGFAKVNANYIKTTTNKDWTVYGVGAVVPVGDFHVMGEYWKNDAQKENNKAWNAGIGYAANGVKLNVAYNRVDKNMKPAGTGIGTDVFTKIGNKDLKFWNVQADVALLKGVSLHGEYAFDVKADDKKVNNDWTVSLNYKF